MYAPQNMLVCITQQITCERLIRKAVELHEGRKGELYVLHVAKNEQNFLDNEKEGEALEYLFNISKSVGANLTVLKSDNIISTIVDFIKDSKINFVLVGESTNIHEENNFIKELKSIVNNVEIYIVPQA